MTFILLIFTASVLAAEIYDLVILNGRVIDPENNLKLILKDG